MKKIITAEYESPCGRLVLGAYGDALCLCDWQTGRDSRRVRDRVSRMLDAEYAPGASAVLERAMAQLDEYFAGERREFDVPLLTVGTDFQKRVWETLRTIPYGTTLSYGEMARRMERPTAVRALANANGANALSIFLPCHRVIGSDNSLTGYGGGLEAKRHLLKTEGVALS